MTTNGTHPQPQIRQQELKLEAILTAILFNIGVVEKMKIKPDDGGPEVEVDVQPVGIVKEEDALICVCDLQKAVHYAQMPHDISVKIHNGCVLIAIEKHYNRAGLYAVNGQKVVNDSPAMKRLLAKLNGAEDESNPVENT